MRHALLAVLLPVLAITAGPGAYGAPAQAASPDAVEAGSVGEKLDELNASVSALVRLVDEWIQESRQSRKVSQLTELDRSITELDRELRALMSDRDGAEAEIRDLDLTLAETERKLDDGSEPSLGELLQKSDRETRLEGGEQKLYRAQERLDHLDARIEEVRATLSERRALRDRISAAVSP